MPIRIKLSQTAGKQIQEDMEGLGQRVFRAVEAAANMIASMWLEQAKDDIANAGNFGSEWTEGVHVTVSGTTPDLTIALSHDIPFFEIFEDGGVITGKPLLWIPLSSTDAEGVRASAYGALFGAKYPRKSGPPLLFAASDKKPRYFGIDQVTIPKKFHLNEIAQDVAGHFQEAFADAMNQEA